MPGRDQVKHRLALVLCIQYSLAAMRAAIKDARLQVQVTQQFAQFIHGNFRSRRRDKHARAAGMVNRSMRWV